MFQLTFIVLDTFYLSFMTWLIFIAIIFVVLAYLYNKGQKAFAREEREEKERIAQIQRAELEKKKAERIRTKEIEEYKKEFLQLIWKLQSRLGEADGNGLISIFKKKEVLNDMSKWERYFYQSAKRMIEIEEGDRNSLIFPAYGNHFDSFILKLGSSCKNYTYSNDGKILTSPKVAKNPYEPLKVVSKDLSLSGFSLDKLLKSSTYVKPQNPTITEGLILGCLEYDKEVDRRCELKKHKEEKEREEEKLRDAQWTEEFNRKRENKIYKKGDSEYVSNGVFEIGIYTYMSIWSYKKMHNIKPNSNEDNGYDSNELRAEGIKSYNSKPDFGGFDTVYIFPVHALDKFYGY